MRDTDHDAVMERVSDKVEVLGFTVMAVSKLDKEHPLVAQLASAHPEADAAPPHFPAKEEPPKEE